MGQALARKAKVSSTCFTAADAQTQRLAHHDVAPPLAGLQSVGYGPSARLEAILCTHEEIDRPDNRRAAYRGEPATCQLITATDTWTGMLC